MSRDAVVLLCWVEGPPHRPVYHAIDAPILGDAEQTMCGKLTTDDYRRQAVPWSSWFLVQMCQECKATMTTMQRRHRRSDNRRTR